MNPISNDQIRLRALEPDDVELLYRWENDPTTWKVSNIHAPLSKYMLASYIKSSGSDIWESRELRLIIETSEGNPVGSVELFDFDPYHSRAGVGILIFDLEERRKGLASNAISLLCNYAFSELGIYQLYANVSESNQPSLDLFKKLGFVHTGTKTDWLRIPGTGWENELLFQKKLGLMH
ncbi:MAG TPA: GNAT family N-acetyltransferase [Prolixibacteraceae bacterium]|nr:GNAT family N-acetyltransferase [Prolixibacteraceae bacterium]HPS11707.1 GNAT family N-acetyltransferase [Prolixibacteraceae bacterium]